MKIDPILIVFEYSTDKSSYRYDHMNGNDSENPQYSL